MEQWCQMFVKMHSRWGCWKRRGIRGTAEPVTDVGFCCLHVLSPETAPRQKPTRGYVRTRHHKATAGTPSVLQTRQYQKICFRFALPMAEGFSSQGIIQISPSAETFRPPQGYFEYICQTWKFAKLSLQRQIYCRRKPSQRPSYS